MKVLETATDIPSIHRAQGDIRTLRKLISMQQLPEINLQQGA